MQMIKIDVESLIVKDAKKQEQKETEEDRQCLEKVKERGSTARQHYQ